MSKDLFIQTGKRGRPQIVLNFPSQGTFNINTLVKLNPHVKCRLSVYTHAKKLIKRGVIRYTGKTIPLNSRGKPLNEFESLANYWQMRSLKRENKLRKLATVTPVDLTPVDLTPA